MFENIKAFIETHKELSGGFGVAVIGLFIIIGSLLRWGWLTEMDNNEYHNMGLISTALYEKFGTPFLRIRNIMIGVILVAVGVFFIIFATK